MTNTIDFRCGCGSKLNAPVSSAGRTVKCPSCGGALAVPFPASPQREIATAPPVEPPKQKPAAKDSKASKRQRAEQLHGQLVQMGGRLLWGAVAGVAAISALQYFSGIDAAETAIQQSAMGAMCAAQTVMAYVFARALQELGRTG